MKPPRPECRDLALLLATGALHLVAESFLHAKGPFLAAAGVGWAVWIHRRRREDPELFRRWGLGRPTAGAWVGAALVTAAAAAALWCLGRRLGYPPPVRPCLTVLLYLPWALVQQVALDGILFRGLERLMPAGRAVVVAGLLFGGAHLPDLPLAAATVAGGIAWTALFRRYRTVWPLAASHAVLGTLAYAALLGRDPWLELVRLASGGPG